MTANSTGFISAGLAYPSDTRPSKVVLMKRDAHGEGAGTHTSCSNLTWIAAHTGFAFRHGAWFSR